MKSRINKILILISSFTLFFTSCKTKCTDNLSAFNEKIPYTNNEIVSFVNDTLGEIKDTIYVKLANMDKYYYYKSNGDTDHWDCSAFHDIKYSNKFHYQIAQGTNFDFNQVGLYIDNYYHSIIDTVYRYKQNRVSALLISSYNNYADSAFWINNESFYYDDYIFIDTPQYKLIEYYTIYQNGDKRKWKINE